MLLLRCRPGIRARAGFAEYKTRADAAAAIAEDTPISAWHPPIAAEIVAPFLNKIPIALEVNKKLRIAVGVFLLQNKMLYSKTEGITPAAPLVGAVTTLPNDAFSSLTANAKQLTQSKIYLKSVPPF